MMSRNNNIHEGSILPSKDCSLDVFLNADAVCFDVDSTVITDEGLDQLATYCGKADQVLRITEEAMKGGLEFRDALKARLNIISPTLETVRNFIKDHPSKLTKDVGLLVKKLQERNVDVYLVSGGFRSLIAPVAKKLQIPLDNIYCNRLKFFFDGQYAGFDEGQPTSRSGGKAEVIHILKEKHGYSSVVMIGDGATDMEACPPADAFIGGMWMNAAMLSCVDLAVANHFSMGWELGTPGFGGNVVRESVKNESTWYVTEFASLIKELSRN